jgi:peroxin-4
MPIADSLLLACILQTGEICLDLLKNAWSAVYTLQAVCRAIINLLAHPEADSPLNCDCGNLLRSGDTRGYNSMARMYAKLYGSSEPVISEE